MSGFPASSSPSRADYSAVTRSRIKAFREECFSIHRQLTAFIDDATAILICEERTTAAARPFVDSLQVKRQLDELFMDSNVPRRTILDGLLATAGQVSAELQAAGRQEASTRAVTYRRSVACSKG